MFVPGHYGDLQKVCGGFVVIKCPMCKGSGKRDGKCSKCQGKGKIRQRCRNWYKEFWDTTRKPQRGIPEEVFRKIEVACRYETVMNTLVIVARESGLRKGELLGLLWSDVLDHEGKIRQDVDIRGQWDDRKGFKPTKSKSPRPAYFTRVAQAALEKFWKSYQRTGAADKDKRIFGLWESEVWRRFRDLQIELKISNPETGRPYRFHDLRHSVGYELVRAGRADLAKKMLGHRKLDTTLKYGEQRAEELIEDVEKVRRKNREEKR